MQPRKLHANFATRHLFTCTNDSSVKILSVEQIRALDAWTIEHEPIASLDLMERAAHAFKNWFVEHYPNRRRPVRIFCGPGNNGGDGLAAARLLAQDFYEVEVWWCRIGTRTSPDFDANLARLRRMRTVPVHELHAGDTLPVPPTGSVVIDALFGSGLSRPVQGYWAELLTHLNRQPTHRVAIDMPSGLFADRHTEGTTFHAHRTLAFELPKLAFFLPENGQAVGEWEVRSIGLDPRKLAQMDTPFHCLTANEAAAWLRPRRKFDHKGHWGHVLLLAGSKGMMGAAVLAARAALRSGAGLVTCRVPACGYEIIQMAAPEAMTQTDGHDEYLATLPTELERFTAIGVGPGLGLQRPTRALLEELFEKAPCPLVLDADALNLLATAPQLLDRLPAGTILTPHPGEFRRLFGESPNDFERLARQREIARDKGIYLLLKGAHTAIATPEGKVWFNTSGNPGMATGGSGDVLTGIVASLRAQGYPPEQAACLGAWLHGSAGDAACAAQKSAEAMSAGDITAYLGEAFQQLHALRRQLMPWAS